MMKTLLGPVLGLVLAQAVGAAETAAPAAASKPPLPYGAPVTLETARACAKARASGPTTGWTRPVRPYPVLKPEATSTLWKKGSAAIRLSN